MILLEIDWMLLLGKAGLIMTIILISFGVAAYATWGERKVAAVMQDRYGPNRAGPFGLLQPLADGLKLFMKEEIIPMRSNKFLFLLAPFLFMLTALMTSAVIPWGPDIELGNGKVFPLQVADVNIGILFVFGVVSLGVYGVMLGGWASNNKFSLLSSIRSASQSISYELAMGLSLIALLMLSGSLSLRDIAHQQHGFITWNIFKQPLGFLIFFTCSVAEMNRAPFDLAECDSELNMGYHLEYSSMKLGMFLFAEYINMFIGSAVMVTLYLGSYNFPWMDMVQHSVNPILFTVICVAVFFAKITMMILLIMFIRWTLPRFRYDQLMNLGWKSLIPLALINMLITGAAVLWIFK